MKKGLKKVMKSKDLHIGLLLMMTTMDQAAASNIPEENEKEDEQGWQRMMFWLCAIVGDRMHSIIGHPCITPTNQEVHQPMYRLKPVGNTFSASQFLLAPSFCCKKQ